MIGMAILAIVTGGILSQLTTAQQRISSEQVKVDNFDQARDFVDQFFRDINEIGYPNGRIVTYTSTSDIRVAVGLVRIDQNAIWFEGDINGSGVVQSVQYQINGSGTCTLCLQRSQVAKVAGNPLTGQTVPGPDWGTEVNDVNTTAPIFTYYDTAGAQILALPADINNNPNILAQVKTIHIALKILNPAVLDQKTHQPIETNFEGEVSLNNCSLAAAGQPMSC
jgi:type II secretory pathway pseudopilin PulG